MVRCDLVLLATSRHVASASDSTCVGCTHGDICTCELLLCGYMVRQTVQECTTVVVASTLSYLAFEGRASHAPLLHQHGILLHNSPCLEDEVRLQRMPMLEHVQHLNACVTGATMQSTLCMGLGLSGSGVSGKHMLLLVATMLLRNCLF